MLWYYCIAKISYDTEKSSYKRKNGKLTFVKIKNVSFKDNAKKMKTWATHWEKIFTKYMLKKYFMNVQITQL